MRQLASTLALFLMVIQLGACPKKEDPSGAPGLVDPSGVVNPHDGHGSGTAGTPAPTSAKSVSFAWPQDGSTVFSEFDVVFAVSGMGLRIAGEDPLDQTTGHHHLIIDSPSIAAGQVVPKNDKYLHFGDASTTAHLTLAPGPHEIEMQLADGAHLSYGPALATKIKIIVKKKPTNTGVSFATLKDGDTVKSPLLVKFAVEGFSLRHAGGDVFDKTSGHHNLIIDGEASALGAVIAKDATHLSFGNIEMQADVTLARGAHKLTLQLADGGRASYGPSMAKTISVTVK